MNLSVTPPRSSRPVLAALTAALAAIAAAESRALPQSAPDPKSGAVTAAEGSPLAGDSLLARLDRELQALAAKVRPVAVEISVRVAPPDALDVPGKGGARRTRLFVDDSPVYFSGTLIDARGLVVTAADAVRFPATRISVRLADSTIFSARPLGIASSLDIGLLQIEGGEAALATFAPEFGDSSAILPGSWVMSVGSPFGLSGTITTGIVSGVGRKLQGATGDYRSLLQVTSPVNPGDAGSPLADSSGRLVGVMALTYRRGGGTATGRGASGGASLAGEFRAFCLAHEGELPRDPDHLSSLWSEFLAATFELPSGGGGKPAETAGDDAVAEGIHFAFPINDVRAAVKEILSKSPAAPPFPSAPPAPALFGLRIHAVGDALASQLGLEPGLQGVVVEEVFEGGWAARSGLRKFDVILSIGGRNVGGPEDVGDAANGLDASEPVPVVVLRQARRLNLELVPGR